MFHGCETIPGQPEFKAQSIPGGSEAGTMRRAGKPLHEPPPNHRANQPETMKTSPIMAVHENLSACKNPESGHNHPQILAQTQNTI